MKESKTPKKKRKYENPCFGILKYSKAGIFISEFGGA